MPERLAKRAMAADKLSDAAAYCKGMGLTLAEAEGLLGEAWRSAKE